MEELFLTHEQVDILGEIANISMGNSATTLSMMVNRKVDITTPNVKVIKRSEALDDYEKTCIFVQIHYVKGLEGNNVLVLKEHDVKVMTNLMMGGDGTSSFGSIRSNEPDDGNKCHISFFNAGSCHRHQYAHC